MLFNFINQSINSRFWLIAWSMSVKCQLLTSSKCLFCSTSSPKKKKRNKWAHPHIKGIVHLVVVFRGAGRWTLLPFHRARLAVSFMLGWADWLLPIASYLMYRHESGISLITLTKKGNKRVLKSVILLLMQKLNYCAVYGKMYCFVEC